MAFRTYHSAALGSVLHLKFDLNLAVTAAHCGCGCVGRLVGAHGSVGVGGSTNNGVGPRSFDAGLRGGRVALYSTVSPLRVWASRVGGVRCNARHVGFRALVPVALTLVHTRLPWAGRVPGSGASEGE